MSESGDHGEYRKEGWRRLAMLLVVAGLVAATSGLIYFPRIADAIQPTDGPEFAYLSVLGGLAHPPGYPLMSILGSQLVALFPENPYYTLSCLSSVLTLVSVLLIGCVCVRLSRSLAIGWMCALSWMILPAVIDIATDADVFALHHLFIICFLVAVLTPSPIFRSRSVQSLAVGLVFGLGLAHHLMLLLWSPLLLAYIFERGSERVRLRLALTIAGALIGYSTILLNFYRFRMNPDLSLAPLNTAAEFIVCILRLGYGALSAGISDEQIQKHWLIPFLEWCAHLAPALLLGIVAIPALLFAESSRIGKALALTVLLHLWFCWQLTSELGMEDLQWMGRFFGAPALSMTILCAAWLRTTGAGIRGIAFSLFLLALTRLPTTLNSSNRRADHRTLAAVNQHLSDAPYGAILISSSDTLGFGGIYQQKIGHVRPDVLIVHDSRLGSPHYRAVLQKQLRERMAQWDSTPESVTELVRRLCSLGMVVIDEVVNGGALCGRRSESGIHR